MCDSKKIITLIPAKQMEDQNVVKHQLRVAAYCRVSTEEEEQQSSYEAQCTYYTDKIMTNPDWSMAGIFADEGITGTSTKKRDAFNRMIRKCKAKKIDLILTKSISRFARNTVDTILYTRMLRGIGIGVYFEKENINTLNMDSEMLITMLGAFSQAESESISRNVSWGKRQALREGKVPVNFNQLYGYFLQEDGTPAIDWEKGEVVEAIYTQYLRGDSLRMIRDRLNSEDIPSPLEGKAWQISTIKGILTNEKFCGDALGQKTFKEGVIGGKVKKNTGQLPQVLVQNNHPGIVTREKFYAVQAEMKRRSSARSPSAKAPTGRTNYASKYALSERLVCGECGTLYRRCTWKRDGKAKIVWRCVSRLDYGTKYCHNSPSMEEGTLQQAIMAAINTVMDSKEKWVNPLVGAFTEETVKLPNTSMTLGDISQRLEELEREFSALFDQMEDGEMNTSRFKEIADEMAVLKKKRDQSADSLRHYDAAQIYVQHIQEGLEQMDNHMVQWDEAAIRQLVQVVKVLSANHILVILNDGTEIKQEVHT